MTIVSIEDSVVSQLVSRASNLLSQTVNKSTVLTLPLDISQNRLLQRTLTNTDTIQFLRSFEKGGVLCSQLFLTL